MFCFTFTHRDTTCLPQTKMTGDATFSFYDTVTISSVSPTTVPHTGRGSITCTGQKFQPMTPKHGLRCRFSDSGAPETVHYTGGNVSADGTSAVCSTPAIGLTGGTWPYTLSLSFNFEDNPAPQWSQSAAISIYTSPIVSRTVPRLISASGGTTVTLIGNNFKDTSTAACLFSSGFSTKATFTSSTQIECVMPVTVDKSAKVSVCVTVNGVDCSDDFDLSVYAVMQV